MYFYPFSLARSLTKPLQTSRPSIPPTWPARRRSVPSKKGNRHALFRFALCSGSSWFNPMDLPGPGVETPRRLSGKSSNFHLFPFVQPPSQYSKTSLPFNDAQTIFPIPKTANRMRAEWSGCLGGHFPFSPDAPCAVALGARGSSPIRDPASMAGIRGHRDRVFGIHLGACFRKPVKDSP